MILGTITFQIHVSFVYYVHKTGVVNDFLRYQIDGDADILVMFWVLKWCPRIVVFNVQIH